MNTNIVINAHYTIHYKLFCFLCFKNKLKNKKVTLC